MKATFTFKTGHYRNKLVMVVASDKEEAKNKVKELLNLDSGDDIELVSVIEKNV